MSAHWSTKYIGLPWVAHGRLFGAWDCYGLVRCVFSLECGIDLPSLAGDYSDPAEQAELDALLSGEHRSAWRKLGPREPLQPFDLLIFGGAVPHVGVAVDAQRMLHVAQGRRSEIVRLEGPRWRRSAAIAGRHVQIDGGRKP